MTKQKQPQTGKAIPLSPKALQSVREKALKKPLSKEEKILFSQYQFDIEQQIIERGGSLLYFDEFDKHILPIIRDPNKMRKLPYKHFIEALAKGKFYKKPLRFLQALQQPPESKQYQAVANILQQIQKPTFSKSTETQERAWIEELDQKSLLDTVSPGIDKAKKIVGIKGEAETLSKVIRTGIRDMLPEEKLMQEGIAKFTPELISGRRKIYAEIKETIGKEKELHEYLQSLEAQCPDESALLKNPEINRKIVETKKQIKDLEDQVNKLKENLDDPKWNEVMNRAAAQFEMINKFLDEYGLEAQNPFLKVKRENEDLLQGITLKDNSLKLKLKDAAGHGKITITEIYFADPDPDEVVMQNPQDRSVDPALGEWRVKYHDSSGTPLDGSLYTFHKQLNEAEASLITPSIPDEDKLKKYVEKKLGYNLQVGNQFSNEFLSLNSSLNQSEVKKEDFEIVAIDHVNGKWIIQLNKEVTTAPKEIWSGLIVDPEDFYDHKSSTFELGEFITFIKKRKVSRTFANQREEERASVIASERYKKRISSIAKGLPEDLKKILYFHEGFEDHGLSEEEAEHAAVLFPPKATPKFDLPKPSSSKSYSFRLGNGQSVNTEVFNNGDGTFNYEIPYSDESGGTIGAQSLKPLLGKYAEFPEFKSENFHQAKDSKGKPVWKLKNVPHRQFLASRKKCMTQVKT